MKRPEILAPAGDAECLHAAVRAGADAVYFGLKGMNARARATNFDVRDLGRTLDFLHEHGTRGYITLNTVVFDDELREVEAMVRAAADAGADALIVQDHAVGRLARAIAPDLPIHASTQMTCTDGASVEYVRSLGAKRAVLARELSVSDIRAIRGQTNAELEVFVHGALCIAYSGQCLTSEAIGGRSANRGACAQACRLPYDLVVDGVVRDLKDCAYLLSPEDLEGTALVPDLIEAGVDALKIEGRLKGPLYVAATTELYRRAVDAAVCGGAPPGEGERRAAIQMFSRGSGPGFLRGVDHQRLVEGRSCDHRGTLLGTSQGIVRFRNKPHLSVHLDAPVALGDGILMEGERAGSGEVGGRVWGLVVTGSSVERAEAGTTALVWLGPDKRLERAPKGPRVWKTSDPTLERALGARNEREPYRIALDLRISGTVGDPPRIEAKTERGGEASVLGDAVIELGRSGGLSEAVAREKLGRLGDTPFGLEGLSIELPEGATVPVASLNRARRALVDELKRTAHRTLKTAPQDASLALLPGETPPSPPPPGGLFVLCRTLPQAEAALDAGADGVYLDFLELTGTGNALRSLREHGPVHVSVVPPRIRKPGEEKIERYLESLAPDGMLVRSLGSLFEEQATAIPRVGDFSLNVTNHLSAVEVLSRGLIAFTPSFDLDGAQLVSLVSTELGPYAEVVVHHPMPLFHMEHCVIAALLSTGSDHRTCGRPCDRSQVSLRDRAGMNHPVEADVGCRNTVFHAVPQSAAGLLPALKKAGVRRYRIELVREDATDVRKVVGAYRALLEGQLSASDVWGLLKAETGYGVVRGSLRVMD